MTRMKPLAVSERSGKSKELLEHLEKKIGRVPNMLATLAHSPAALEAYMSFSGTLKSGALSAKEREALAVHVGKLNACDYCVAAHSQFAKGAGLSGEEIEGAKEGRSSNARLQALLTFASEVVEKRGFVSEAAISAAKQAGVTEAELLEAIAEVSLNIYTNYLNHFMDPSIDF